MGLTLARIEQRRRAGGATAMSGGEDGGVLADGSRQGISGPAEQSRKSGRGLWRCTRVRAACGSSAARNRAGGRLTGDGFGPKFRPWHGRIRGKRARGASWRHGGAPAGLRWSGVWRGGVAAAAWPLRRRELGAAEQVERWRLGFVDGCGWEGEGGAGLRGQLKGAPGILGRRAQGEAGGNHGRDRGRALREEEDDADGWARAGRGGARAPRAAARAGARGGPGRVTRGRPGSELGRGSGRARWASRDWAAHGVCWAERGRESWAALAGLRRLRFGPGFRLGWVFLVLGFLFLSISKLFFS